jgi:RNA polymerase sigma factor (sigma-70 family)
MQAGDDEAARKLFERYFRRLVGLARKKIQGAPRPVADEEDVALSAFKSFWLGATRGRFPRLDDRDNLWRLLFTLTARKAYQYRRRPKPDARPSDQAVLEQLIAREPTPDIVEQLKEEYEQRLGRLPPRLRPVAQWKMENYTNAEIAAKLGCALRTVEHGLHVIRKLWQDPEDAG